MADMLDKIKHDMNKYIGSLGEKAGELAETAKIKFEVYNLNRQRDEILLRLGKIVYKMYLRGNLDGKKVDEICMAVMEIDKQIKEVYTDDEGSRHKKKNEKDHNKENSRGSRTKKTKNDII